MQSLTKAVNTFVLYILMKDSSIGELENDPKRQFTRRYAHGQKKFLTSLVIRELQMK